MDSQVPKALNWSQILEFFKFIDIVGVEVEGSQLLEVLEFLKS